MDRFFTVLIVSILLNVLSVRGQNLQFPDMYLEPDTIQSGKYKNFESYDLGYMVLYKKSKKASNFTIADKSTDVEIFTYRNTIPHSHLGKPKFFQSSDSKHPIILLIDVLDLYSYGVEVFLIEGSEVTHSGFIEYAADNFNFSSLALYSHFHLIGDKIIMSFDDIDLIDLRGETLVKGGVLKFEIQKENIVRYTE